MRRRTPEKKGTWRQAPGLLRKEGWVSVEKGMGDRGQNIVPLYLLGEACGCVGQLRKSCCVLRGRSLVGSLQQGSGLSSLLASPRFEEENQRLLELNQRCQFAASATIQWLDIRLQLMGATVVSAIAGIALVQHQQGLTNPGATPGASLSTQKHPRPPSLHCPPSISSPTLGSCEDVLSLSSLPF